MSAAKHEATDAPRLQYAALPWRSAAGLEILLVSSRDTKRWIIPKGWPIEGLSAHAAAAREAFEEAGVTGEVEPAAVGHFHYLKRQKDGTARTCLVQVYALKVEAQETVWPEQAERTTRWFSAAAAAEAVEELELKVLIRGFATERKASGA
jgi:8-oxo-dGTP pyrophosphatase MutT (NUDIX family)